MLGAPSKLSPHRRPGAIRRLWANWPVCTCPGDPVEARVRGTSPSCSRDGFESFGRVASDGDSRRGQPRRHRVPCVGMARAVPALSVAL
jgi:hypothetical protein